MKRQLEPELMLDEAQVKAYAEADFEEPHSHFITLFNELLGEREGKVLDLGCGAGDISFRFASQYPNCQVQAVDASDTMLKFANTRLQQTKLKNLEFFQAYLPNDALPSTHYDIIISNSLLHHLPDPEVLWQTIKSYSQPETIVFIMDLMRPENEQQAKDLLKTYASNEPEVLQHDFYHSLLAAFEIQEVQQQLQQVGLNLNCKVISDRHFIVFGQI